MLSVRTIYKRMVVAFTNVWSKILRKVLLYMKKIYIYLPNSSFFQLVFVHIPKNVIYTNCKFFVHNFISGYISYVLV